MEIQIVKISVSRSKFDHLALNSASLKSNSVRSIGLFLCFNRYFSPAGINSWSGSKPCNTWALWTLEFHRTATWSLHLARKLKALFFVLFCLRKYQPFLHVVFPFAVLCEIDICCIVQNQCLLKLACFAGNPHVVCLAVRSQVKQFCVRSNSYIPVITEAAQWLSCCSGRSGTDSLNGFWWFTAVCFPDWLMASCPVSERRFKWE